MILLALACTSTTSLTGDTNCEEAATLQQYDAATENSSYAAPYVEGACTSDTFQIASNDIPHFEFVAITPNGLSEQDDFYEIPLEGVLASSPQDIAFLGEVAVTVTGLRIYGPNEGPEPDAYGDPVYNDIVDRCLGHTAQVGDYHNHALLVECLVQGVTDDEPDPVIAWSFDGFPIYGPRGCADADCTEIVEYESGWETTGDPTTYAWDNHEYVGGELDACNGHTGPEGDYHYHATSAFPYILGCYAGEL